MPNADGSPTIQELLAQGGGPAPLAPTGDDLLARLEADPAGKLIPQTQAQALGLGRGSIAPPQPAPVQTGAMKPVFNSLGEKIGEKPEVKSAPLFQNPLAPRHEAPPAAAPEPKPGAPVTYAGSGGGPSTPGNLREQTAGGFFVPAGFGAGGGGRAAGNPFKNRLAALDQAQQGNTLVRQLQQRDTANQSAALGGEATEMRAMAEQQNAKNETDKERVQKASDAYANVVKDAPHESIDQDRWWKSRSTGQGVAAVLSTMMSGFVSGYQGRNDNPALEQINRLVERDISEQQANIAQRGREHAEKTEGAKTAYEMIRTSVHDDAAAADLTKAWTLDRIAAEGRQRALATQDVNQIANWKQQESAIHMQKAELQDKALAAMAKGKPAFDRNKFTQLATQFWEKGMPQDQAELAAARFMGLTKQGGGNPTLENAPGGKHASAEERQYKIDAINKAMTAAEKNPVLDQGDMTSGLLSKFPSRMAPDTAKLEAALNSIDMQTSSPVMSAFKDSEGRIPPPVVEQLERTAPHITDPPDVRRAKIEARRNIVNTMGEFLPGVTAPKQANPASLQSQIAGYKPAAQ